MAAFAGEFFSPDKHGDHLALTLGQLLLHGRTHDFSGLASRDTESLQIVSRPGKDDLEIAGVRCQPGLVQAVINHLVAHPAEAAAAFLDAVKERETLSQDGIAGTGPVLARAEFLQGERWWRQARTRDHNTVGKDLQHDLARTVLVIAMSDGVD